MKAWLFITYTLVSAFIKTGKIKSSKSGQAKNQPQVPEVNLVLAGWQIRAEGMIW